MRACADSRDRSEIAPYLNDEGGAGGGRASRVCWPNGLDQARDLIASCFADGTPVTVSGAGTGLCGGRIPAEGVVLATDRLPRRLDLLPADDRAPMRFMRVSAGASLSDVAEAAASAGLFFPPDPTEQSAFVGGAVSTNAAGRRSYRFGSMRAWVEALLVVFADGASASIGRGEIASRGGIFEIPVAGGAKIVEAPDWPMPATSKYAAGYHSSGAGLASDFVDLICGSEGTLAVVLEVVLRLLPSPRETASGLFFFDGDDRALQFVDEARAGRGVSPWSLELYDAASVSLAAADGPELPRGQAAVYFEQPLASGRTDPTLDSWHRLGERLGAGPASILAIGGADTRRLAAMRHTVPESLNRWLSERGVPKVASDAAVPRGAVRGWLERARADCASRGLDCVAFGHAGDDHVHVNVLPSSLSHVPAAREACDRMAIRAARMGGVVSAEHGLGKTKRHLLEPQHGARVAAKMRRIKDALDPDGILGVDTLFDSPRGRGSAEG